MFTFPALPHGFYRVALLNYLFVFPRDKIAREQGESQGTFTYPAELILF
jgi:hypothetical protein